ncbi:hypothetical protein H8D30_02360 [bacterium]|nr:hypothetical protein [bacterium]
MSMKGTTSWWLQRVSGILLLVFVGIHFVDVHFVIGVENLSFERVAQKWNLVGWRIFDACTLGLGMLHGCNGVISVLDDFKALRPHRKKWLAGVRILGISVTLLGAWVLITFQPEII